MGEIALRPGFNTEDKVGLGVAIVLHVLLVALLAMQFMFSPPRSITPQRMTVSLAAEVSLESASPDPVAESRAAIAPTLSDEVAPEVDPVPVEQPDAAVPPPPPPRQARSPARTEPRTPAPPTERSRPDRERAQPAGAARNSGGSRIGDNFLEGQGSSTRTDEAGSPTATFGRRERAALSSAITRQLRPHWNAPTGVDAEKLVSTVSWRLNQDGSLRGRPTCRNQSSSITASNRPQAGLHCERAIRAVQLAAPFNLPEQFYSRWDDLEWQFDRRL